SGSPFPYGANVELSPDPGTSQERAETVAQDSGAHQGLAGVIFSPSFIAGDSYTVTVALAPRPYPPSLGYLNGAPVSASTGTLTIWRLSTIAKSLRPSTMGTNGYPLAAASPPESPGRVFPGDGLNMNFESINNELGEFFNEWQVVTPPS